MQRRKYSEEFKVKVTIEAVKGLETVNEIAGESGVHLPQRQQWKKRVLEGLPNILNHKQDRSKNKTKI